MVEFVHGARMQEQIDLYRSRVAADPDRVHRLQALGSADAYGPLQFPAAPVTPRPAKADALDEEHCCLPVSEWAGEFEGQDGFSEQLLANH